MPETSGKSKHDSRVLTTLGRLRTDPKIAQKCSKILKFTSENAAAAHDAAEALKMLKEGKKGLGGIALASAAAASGGTNAEALEMKSASVGLSLANWTLNMSKALDMTPGRASAYVTVAFMQKAVAVAGIASESEANECRVAMGKLAADVAATALTWETGVGGVLGVGSALLDGYIAYQACAKEKAKEVKQ